MANCNIKQSVGSQLIWTDKTDKNIVKPYFPIAFQCKSLFGFDYLGNSINKVIKQPRET